MQKIDAAISLRTWLRFRVYFCRVYFCVSIFAVSIFGVSIFGLWRVYFYFAVSICCTCLFPRVYFRTCLFPRVYFSCLFPHVYVPTVKLFSDAFGWIELKLLSYCSRHWAELGYNYWAISLCSWPDWVKTVKAFSYAHGWIELKLLSYFLVHVDGLSLKC